MQQGLTSRLSQLLVFSVFLLLCGPLRAEQSNGLDSAESSQYLAELKALYLTQDDRQALLAHSNALLKTYALRAAYQVEEPNPQDLDYCLSVGAPGELRIREERRDAGADGAAVAEVQQRSRGVAGFVGVLAGVLV